MLIIINGINSEICQSIIKKLLINNNVIGIYKSSYKGLKHKNLILIKHKKINSLSDIFIKNQKIIFLNFAVRKIDDLLIKISNKKINESIHDNIISPLYILKLIIPSMIKNNFGRIIFFSSSDAHNGIKGSSIYSLSKTSLIGLSNSLAKEYSSFGITSNIISLGYFKTKLWDALPDLNKKEMLNKTLSKNLIKTYSVYKVIRLIINEENINKSITYLDDGIS